MGLRVRAGDDMPETESQRLQRTEWILRIAMFGTFFGHGVLAVMQKQKFVTMFTGMAGLIGWSVSQPAATQWVVWIGIIDILVALAILWRPVRVLLVWGVLWAFVTALARPMAGGWNIFATIGNPNVDNLWDFVERAANFGIPLALLWLRGLPKTWKEWFT
jgi:hypothetical protein